MHTPIMYQQRIIFEGHLRRGAFIVRHKAAFNMFGFDFLMMYVRNLHLTDDKGVFIIVWENISFDVFSDSW